jgi:hypothetical protein
MAFKAKHGHCYVPRTGVLVSLGSWCSVLRSSYKNIQNNQMPRIQLSDGQIQRLNDAGFKLSPVQAPPTNVPREILVFDNRFNNLMAFKAKHGHCYVPRTGEYVSLGSWCSEVRASYINIQNNQPPRMKLSNEQIQRLNDAGF